MGPTGAGKSSVSAPCFGSRFPMLTFVPKFINALIGETKVEVGHSYKSCTVSLQPVNIPQRLVEENLPGWGPGHVKDVILVDTPGFDDTHTSDSDILKSIANWLAET